MMMNTSDMANIEHIRHTLAHLLAAAMRQHHKDAKPTIGPAVENGFYYDFDAEGLKEGDLAKIEKTMRKLLPSWKDFTHREVSAKEAREVFKDNPYKRELIDELEEKGEKITLYKCGHSTSSGQGGFEDLCRGGHCEHPSKDISPDSFKLDRLAGAYWRGDEKNKMLTRVYGLAFPSKEELDAYLTMREEAQKRDHKILGKTLDLFTFSELVGPGLPLWTPKGTTLRNLLDDFVWELRKPYGYLKVEIPHITKKDLYETSGHWDKFKDELFRITTREGHEFAMKPMNCPHHTQIYARHQWSYRELPQRYANSTTCYRDEQTGELSGLSRVRAFTQDDAHVFCRMTQAKDEFLKIWDIIHTFYPSFGFALRVRLSLHDPREPQKYLGDKKNWAAAEGMLREIIDEKRVDWFEGVGEAAFYGPKLDFMAKDAIGREWQVATIQLDMNMPERFDLTCINEKGEKELIVMIHAAIMGSIDRFLAILIEHTAGIFPLWLSPVQMKILPVSEKHTEYSNSVLQKLTEAGIRVELDDSDSLGKRIRNVKLEKVPYFLVIGDQEVSDGTATLEGRAGKVGAFPVAEILEKLKKEIADRT